jgi:uncharacterized membrane protein (UPF0127 family)
MKFKFNYGNKIYEIEVEECKTTLEKARGLMFRKNSKPLLFYFKKETRTPIHSFFCKPFAAIWFNKDKIIDIKFVKSWGGLIAPKTNFDKLLEIPSNNSNFKYFADDRERFK